MGMQTRAMTWGPGSGFCEKREKGLRGLAGGRPDSWSLLPRLALVVMFGVIGIFGGGQAAEAAECSNETLRAAESSTFLPDCRAFELVSPPEGVPEFQPPSTHETIGVRASSAGGGIAWFSSYPLSGSLGGKFYNISIRSQGGWSTQPVGPRLSPTNSGFGYCESLMVFSADLSAGILVDGKQSSGPEQTEAGECPGNDPALVLGEPEGFQNVFLRDSASGAYALANVTPEGVTPSDAWLQDTSDDFSRVVFEDGAKLTKSAPVGASLYEWVAGAVSLVTVLPNGTPTVGSFPSAVRGGSNQGTALITHPMSANGTRVIFEAEGKLFLRENVEQKLESVPGPGAECAKACTVQLDASQGGGGSFLAANTTDTRIFFIDGAGVNQHLYGYDTQTGQLTDLTPAGGLGLMGLSGIDDEGSYLYIVAQAALAAGATAGQPNLYVFHDGTVGFIAALNPEDAGDWRLERTLARASARVSPNGRYIGFNSLERLTGYDNTPVQPEDCLNESAFGPCQEIFLYDAQSNLPPICVSCASSGAPPTGPAVLPAAEPSGVIPGPLYLQRNVLDDGRVFFDTASPLLPGAVNGVSNVYEFSGKQLSLISSGTSESSSFFYEASPNGDDVFFVTTQHLVGGDTGNEKRLYDARVDGGFIEQEVVVQCSGEGCRGAVPGAPLSPTLATSALQGSGNLSPRTVVKPKPNALSRARKLSRALKACKVKHNKKQRAICKKRARHLYGKAKS